MGASQQSQVATANTAAEQKVLSKTGRATYDLKTNTLIVTDSAKKIQEVRELLAKIDVPARQIMIEARVVIADERWSRELGSKLLLSGGAQLGKIGGDRHNLGIGQTYADAANRAVTPGSLPAGVAAPNFDFGAAQGAKLGLALLNAATGNLISLELSALEADNRGKIISSPRVVTGNQKPAVILQGQQIPYTTTEVADGARVTTVKFKDALLCLLVDPQILNNDAIIMNVEVQKDAIGENVLTPTGAIPAIDTRRLKTQVRVTNGETAVLGGIFEQVKRNDVSKIPFLGDLPFLGNLFKNTKKDEATVELIIFLTPRILDERVSLR